MKRWWITAGFFVLGVGLFWPHSSQAEGFNLITSPLPINVTGVPGSTITTQIRVKNGASTAQTLKVTLMKFRAYGEAGKPELLNRESGDDYFDWVKFNPAIFSAPPNEWQTVTMTINLPKTAAFGYYYAVVFSPANLPANLPQQNVIVGSTAVLVLVDAENPGAKRSLTITNFSSDHRMYEFLPANFTVRLHNDGNIHVVPHGDIFIKEGSKPISTIDVNPQNGNVLPASNRLFQVGWSSGFPVYTLNTADGRSKRQLNWDFTQVPKLRFGHYTADLVLAYDNGQADVPLQASLSFWVIPWRILAAGLVIVGLIGLGLYSIIHRSYRRLKRRRQ